MDAAQASAEWAKTAGDFVRYGVPSICTAAVAILTAKFIRSHEERKERRRRRQDFLERVVEQLDRAALPVNNAVARLGALDHFRHEGFPSEISEAKVMQDVMEAIAKMEDAEADLYLVESKIGMFGFTDCMQMFQDHCLALGFLKGAMLKCLGREMTKAQLDDARVDWQVKRLTFVQKLTRAFETV